MANQRVKDFMVGTLIGGAVGAVTALLFAPKPGRELRADIAEGYHAVSDKTAEIARSVGSHTSDFFAKAKQVAVQVVETVRSGGNDIEEDDDQTVIAIAEQQDQQDPLASHEPQEDEEPLLVGSK